MVKDYNANSTSNNAANGGGGGGAESEDEEDPRTPTSVSSSQGYDSAGSDFVDIEGFTAIPDSSLPELNLQVRMDSFLFVQLCHVRTMYICLIVYVI